MTKKKKRQKIKEPIQFVGSIARPITFNFDVGNNELFENPPEHVSFMCNGDMIFRGKRISGENIPKENIDDLEKEASE